MNNQIISLDYITKNLFLDQIDNIIRKIDLELELNKP